MKLTKFNDPGHGWLKVPISLLKALEIEKDISSFSYMRGEYAYLEEDCDAFKFETAMKKINNPFEIKDSHTNNQSKIRNYNCYKNYTPEEQIEKNKLRDKMLHCRNWNKRSRNKINIASLDDLKYWQKQYKF